MQYLACYYKLGEDGPAITSSTFQNVQRLVAKNTLRHGSEATLDEIARVELIPLYHQTGHEIQCVTLDGEVVGTWGEPLAYPITEYFGAPPFGRDATEDDIQKE